MARYRKVDPRMWNDQKVRQLSNDAKLLWAYLLTAPESTSVPGVIPLFPVVVAARFGWELDHVLALFTELDTMAQLDADAGLVWLPNAIHHNQPANPNVVRGWRTAWAETPECDLKDQAWEGFATNLERFGELFRELYPKANARVADQCSPAPAPAPVQKGGSGGEDDAWDDDPPTVQSEARELEQHRRRRAADRRAQDWNPEGWPVAPPCPRCERPLRLRRNSKTGILWYNHHIDVGMGCDFHCDAEELQDVRKAQYEQLKREGRVP